MKTAIIGIGNKLMGDEGVGIHVVECLRTRACHSRESAVPAALYWRGNPVDAVDPCFRRDDKVADLIDGGTGGMALLHILEKYEKAIIIDAADFGGKPGEVRNFEINNPPCPPFFKGGWKEKSPPLKKGGKGGFKLVSDNVNISLHETGLAGVLELAKQLGTKLPDITIIAVQPEKITPSLELSPAVKNAIQVVVAELISLT